MKFDDDFRPLIYGILVLSLTLGSLHAQPLTPEVEYFMTTEDFTKNNAGKESVVPFITLEAPEFIKIPKWIDKSTGKKSKTVVFPWAVKYRDTLYITLRYCIEYQNFSIYVKPHVIGRYYVLNINKNTPNEIKNGGQYYGGGLQGVLLKDMDKWGNNWSSEVGTKNKILIVDTHDIDLWYVDKIRAASWFLLDRKNFNDILNLAYTDEEVKSLSWEQVMEIISNINAEE